VEVMIPEPPGLNSANAPHRKLVLSDCGRAERLATEHRPVGRKARRDAR
jgi:hypothetical protein